MNDADTVARARRREEAYLLVCRALSELERMHRDIDEIRADARDLERMRRDPACVEENLAAVHNPLMRYDLLRLLDLMNKGL